MFICLVTELGQRKHLRVPKRDRNFHLQIPCSEALPFSRVDSMVSEAITRTNNSQMSKACDISLNNRYRVG